MFNDIRAEFVVASLFSMISYKVEQKYKDFLENIIYNSH